MPEIWQKALSQWDKWTQSIDQTRAQLLKKYGDLERFYERSLELHYQADIGALPKNLESEFSKSAIALWDIHSKVDSTGSRFIADNIGLQVGAGFHSVFLDYWTRSVIPELTQGWDEKRSLGKYFLDEGLMNLFHSSKIDRSRGKEEILDSVSWYRGKVDTAAIIRIINDEHLLPDMPTNWPSFKELEEREQGGAPQKGLKEDAEAIVCFILNKKQKLTQAAIACLFGWKTHRDSYGNWMSNTVRNRVKRGKEILGE